MRGSAWMARCSASVAPVAPKLASVSRGGMAEARPLDARQHQRLGNLRQSELALERGGRGGEGRHARRQRIGDAERVELAQLLADRAPHREIAGMKPRHVLARAMGGHELGHDLIEAHGRGVDDARARGTEGEHVRLHERAGIEADRAAREEVAAAQREEVGGAGAGADEMHGHGFTIRGSAASGFTALHCVTVMAGRKAALGADRIEALDREPRQRAAQLRLRREQRPLGVQRHGVGDEAAACL